MLVVAAALVRDGRVLAAHRPGRGWEFPGGKVESGETPPEALIRECREELGVDVEPLRELGTATDDGLELQLWRCELAGAAPMISTDHDELRWLGRTELDHVDWLAADLDLLDVIRPMLG